MELSDLKKANELRIKREQLVDHIAAVESHTIKLIVPLDENKQLEIVMTTTFKQRILEQVLEQLRQQLADIDATLKNAGVTF